MNDICKMLCFCLVLFWCQSSEKLSEPSLPIEDSQDLYNASPEPKTLFLGAGDFQFSLEDDTQSQLLDADGLVVLCFCGWEGAGHCLILFKNKVSFCHSICAFSSEEEKMYRPLVLHSASLSKVSAEREM